MDKVFILIFVLIQIITSKRLFTNKWIVHIRGGHEDAAKIATRHGLVFNGEIFQHFYRFTKVGLPQKATTPSVWISNRLLKDNQVVDAHQILWKRIYPRTDFIPNDRLWSDMWYVHKTINPSMKIVEAWESGFTGRGVTIGIVDNGVEINHPDLKTNVNNALSFDFMDSDNDPSPDDSTFNHGTLCAGTAAAVCNNTLCGCGIAYNAFIAGIKNNNGATTSDIEAQSLVHKMDEIAIYSNSWGESDDTDFGGPDQIVEEALLRGIHNGRSSKGSIYVWASGNSGPHDNCNADGYVTSIYTIAIASVSRGGYVASYGETCSAILAATYASGRTSIVTTDTNGGCHKKFTGTSASTPIAAAIFSLVLQANNQLTWRDIQHLTIQTSSMTDLIDAETRENGVGRKVSHYYGFGLLNADAMIKAAKNWRLVSQQIECTESSTDTSLTIGGSREVNSNITTILCGNKIDRLEHVVAHITFDCTRRGEVELLMTSPQGTQSKLLTKRRHDISSVRSFSWKFMSLHYWGENPSGTWSLKMSVKDKTFTGSLIKWKLVFYGTKDHPNLNDFNSSMSALNERENTIFQEENNLVVGGSLGAVFIIVLFIFLTYLFYIKCCKKKERRINHSPD